MKLLESYNYIRRVTKPGNNGGRPSEVYEINPALKSDTEDFCEFCVEDIGTNF